MYAKYSGTSGSCHSEARSAQMEVVPRSLSEKMSSHFCSHVRTARLVVLVARHELRLVELVQVVVMVLLELRLQQRREPRVHARGRPEDCSGRSGGRGGGKVCQRGESKKYA